MQSIHLTASPKRLSAALIPGGLFEPCSTKHETFREFRARHSAFDRKRVEGSRSSRILDSARLEFSKSQDENDALLLSTVTSTTKLNVLNLDGRLDFFGMHYNKVALTCAADLNFIIGKFSPQTRE